MVFLGRGGGNMSMDFDEIPQRNLPKYEGGPPLSYMERIAEKRQLEEVNSIGPGVEDLI